MLAYSYLRFSSTEQRKGYSIKRQLELRDAYLQRKGLTLDASFVLNDSGMSAFRGKNATKGALKVFLDACEQGRISRGSYLIIENLDRLTRDEIIEAIELFLSIIRHGITIVTLTPEREINKENLDFAALVIVIVELSRGHSESFIKSAHTRANWDKRRKNVENEAFCKHRPAWLDFAEGKFVINPVKAAVVRRIFAMASQGHGIGAIAKVFNREGVPCISKSKHWYDTYIHKVLVNRGCIGEWQPRMLDEESGRFLPVGQPIKGYYPSVVTEEEFYRGQQALKSRKLTHARTDLVRNLFTEILFAPDGSSYRLR